MMHEKLTVALFTLIETLVTLLQKKTCRMCILLDSFRFSKFFQCKRIKRTHRCRKIVFVSLSPEGQFLLLFVTDNFFRILYYAA